MTPEIALEVASDEELPLEVASDQEDVSLEATEVIEGGGVNVEELSVTANGTYTAPEGSAYTPVVVAVPQPSGTKQISISANGTTTHDVEDYKNAQIVVAVPNSYAVGDEGKVVKNGALVAQTARSSNITQNGVYDTTENNSVTVAVPAPSGAKTVNISQNGTTTENVSGYASAEIIVAVPVPTLISLTATDNGTYTPESGKAYSSVTVSIPSASGVSF